MAEFKSPAYSWMFKTVETLPSSVPFADDTLRLTLHDDTALVLHRSINFFVAPRIVKGGSTENLSEGLDWYPALTSIRWLMMLLYCKNEGC